MNNFAIHTEDLGKRYKLGATVDLSRTFREALIEFPNKFMSKSKRIAKELLEKQSGIVYDNETPKGTFWALRDINLEIKHGDVVGIIGRNGAGKSTLLKVLSRITNPTKGYAEIHGRVGSLLEVGTGFHAELSGRENIYLSGAVMGMKKAEIDRKFDEIVAFAEVEQFLDTPVKRYSSGMYVRLAFAVAAHLEPEILIVDEVLAVGDIQFQKKCLGKMGEVSKEGRTVLFVSHNLGAVASLCKRAIQLDHGKLINNDKTSIVIDDYLKQKISSEGEMSWESPASAPGSANVKLKSIRVVTDTKGVYEIDMQEEVVIEIEFWNFKPGIKITTFMQINNAMGVTVFWGGNLPSINLSNDIFFDKAMEKGIYITQCRIPKNFLSPGKYLIDLSVNSNLIYNEIILNSAAAFEIVNKSGYCKEYNTDFAGVVSPKLFWETDFKNSI